MTDAQVPRRRRPLVWTLAVLALVTVLVGGAVAWTRYTADNSGAVARTGNGQPGMNVKPGLDLYPVNRRVAAPALEGTTLDGKPFALTDLSGKTVVINVWGSWCGPCRAETPDLVRLANENGDRGVRFLGINTRDNPAAAKAFVRNFKVPYPSIEDPRGQVLLAFRGVIPTSVVPSTIVIDPQGRIAARIIGPVTYTTLNGILDDELATGGSR